MEGLSLAKTLDGEFRLFFRNAFRIIRKMPGYFVPMIRHVVWQRRASRKRLKSEASGVHVPPFLIFSVTKQCNLNCSGCYSKHLHHHAEEDLKLQRIDQIIQEAEALGISNILLAGGEPLIRRDIISVAANHPRIIFPVFTNGMLIDDAMAREFSTHKNLIPIISMEGDMSLTDSRRGIGVYASIVKTFEALRQHKAIFGTSITVTRENFDQVTSNQYLKTVCDLGCKVMFYIEYIPCSENSQDLVITAQQRQKLKEVLNNYRKTYPMILVSFPGDEEVFGGCLAAGRGFVHISSSGRLEPCPFSPHSDVSLKTQTLADALKSKFLSKIRENRDVLGEHEGGCALWENREWVENALNDTAGLAPSERTNET